MAPSSDENMDQLGGMAALAAAATQIMDGCIYVTTVQDQDVLLGKGSGPNKHVGNILYRQLVAERRKDYLTAERNCKSKIAEDIVHGVIDSGGKFLKEVQRGKLWSVVEPNMVMEKTKQTLRDSQPNHLMGKPQKRRNWNIHRDIIISPPPKPSRNSSTRKKIGTTKRKLPVASRSSKAQSTKKRRPSDLSNSSNAQNEPPSSSKKKSRTTGKRRSSSTLSSKKPDLELQGPKSSIGTEKTETLDNIQSYYLEENNDKAASIDDDNNNTSGSTPPSLDGKRKRRPLEEWIGPFVTP